MNLTYLKKKKVIGSLLAGSGILIFAATLISTLPMFSPQANSNVSQALVLSSTQLDINNTTCLQDTSLGQYERDVLIKCRTPILAVTTDQQNLITARGNFLLFNFNGCGLRDPAGITKVSNISSFNIDNTNPASPVFECDLDQTPRFLPSNTNFNYYVRATFSDTTGSITDLPSTTTSFVYQPPASNLLDVDDAAKFNINASTCTPSTIAKTDKGGPIPSNTFVECVIPVNSLSQEELDYIRFFGRSKCVLSQNGLPIQVNSTYANVSNDSASVSCFFGIDTDLNTTSLAAPYNLSLSRGGPNDLVTSAEVLASAQTLTSTTTPFVLTGADIVPVPNPALVPLTLAAIDVNNNPFNCNPIDGVNLGGSIICDVNLIALPAGSDYDPATGVALGLTAVGMQPILGPQAGGDATSNCVYSTPLSFTMRCTAGISLQNIPGIYNLRIGDNSGATSLIIDPTYEIYGTPINLIPVTINSIDNNANPVFVCDPSDLIAAGGNINCTVKLNTLEAGSDYNPEVTLKLALNNAGTNIAIQSVENPDALILVPQSAGDNHCTYAALSYTLDCNLAAGNEPGSYELALVDEGNGISVINSNFQITLQQAVVTGNNDTSTVTSRGVPSTNNSRALTRTGGVAVAPIAITGILMIVSGLWLVISNSKFRRSEDHQIMR